MLSAFCLTRWCNRHPSSSFFEHFTKAKVFYMLPFIYVPSLPFLFVLYMEPLLRWLRAGDKGYKAGALAYLYADAQQTHQIADITYADDINISSSPGLPNRPTGCLTACPQQQHTSADKRGAWDATHWRSSTTRWAWSASSGLSTIQAR